MTKRKNPEPEGAGVDFAGLDAFTPASEPAPSSKPKRSRARSKPDSPPERLPGEQRLLEASPGSPAVSVHPIARSIAETHPAPSSPQTPLYGRRGRGHVQLNVSVPPGVKLALERWCQDQTLALRAAMPDAGARQTQVTMSEVIERLIRAHLERLDG